GADRGFRGRGAALRRPPPALTPPPRRKPTIRRAKTRAADLAASTRAARSKKLETRLGDDAGGRTDRALQSRGRASARPDAGRAKITPRSRPSLRGRRLADDHPLRLPLAAGALALAGRPLDLAPDLAVLELDFLSHGCLPGNAEPAAAARR